MAHRHPSRQRTGGGLIIVDGVDSTTVWRTCIGCRERSPQTALVRIVAVPELDRMVMTPDRKRSMPGRGAHLHPDRACLELAMRRKAFGRALKVEGPIELHLVEQLVTEVTENRPTGVQPLDQKRSTRS